MRVVENRNMEELLQNKLHFVIEELVRWKEIIGNHYIEAS